MVGTISLRSEKITSIDVDFSNKNFHRNLVLSDDYQVSMAALNYSGMLLASKGSDTNEDEYENDEEVSMDMDAKVNHKNSHVYYKPFNEWKNFREWHMELKDGEKAECLALGSGWCAVQTDFGYVRVFSMEGI